MKIILASQSPRRHEILNLVKIPHEVVPSNAEEVIKDISNPAETVLDICYQKALDVAIKYPNDVVIGADTIVVIDNKILGKPKDEQDAINMLSMLSGKTHQVLTGVCIIKNQEVIKFVETSSVTFYDMTKDEILDYIHSEQVYDKAGSYAIQGMCAKHIKEINGDYYNIMGLPISRLYQTLKQNKIIL